MTNPPTSHTTSPPRSSGVAGPIPASPRLASTGRTGLWRSYSRILVTV